MKTNPPKKTSITAITNNKGGVGKTTSALNLSFALARKDEKVLVIDGDPQASLTQFFTAEEEGRGMGSLLQSMFSGEKIICEEEIYSSSYENLFYIPMFSRKLRTEIDERIIWESRDNLYSFLNSLKTKFQHIIIDTAPSNGFLEKTLLYCSNNIIIPLEYQVFSVRVLHNLIKDINELVSVEGANTRVSAIVFTRVDKRLIRTREYEDIFKDFSTAVFSVSKSESVAKALESHKSIWEIDSLCPAALDYEKIVNECFSQ